MKTDWKKLGVLLRDLMAGGLAVLALAQGASPGSEPPKLHGQTLDGKTIVLPDAAVGKVTLLVLGASKKGGERTGPWKDHFHPRSKLAANLILFHASLPKSHDFAG